MLPLMAVGQDWATPYEYAVKSVQVVYSDSAKVRDAAGLKGAITDTLLPLQAVTIVAKKDDMASGAKRAAWYQVNYMKNGQARTGYLWGGLLAVGKMKLGELQFVYGIEGKFRPIKDVENDYVPSDSMDVTIGLKAYQKGVLADAAYYDISKEALNGCAIEPKAAKGVPGCRSLVVLHFSGEACAIPTYHHYFGWTGRKLIALPPLQEEADAGAFAHGETYVFPTDAGGKPGVLIKKIEDTSYEELPDGKEKEKTTRTQEVYRWDATGQRYVKGN